jgi:hypothetical protein
VSIEVGTLIAIVSVVVAVLSYFAARSSADRKNGGDNAEMRAKLNYISNGVDDTRLDVRGLRGDIAHQADRLARVEESSKQAHKRIDEVKAELKNDNGGNQ